MEKTIEIPEGYEARIEGNKVILEPKESEDERIREAIESIIRVYGKTQGEWIAGYDMDTLVVHLRDAFAYLERQKEQKPEEWNDADMRKTIQNLISCCRDWERGEKTTLLPVVAVRARYFLEHLTEPQQPAEWSEEDEEMFAGIIADIKFTQRAHNHEVNQIVYEREIDWLKSLRDNYKKCNSRWKPSEEQMLALGGVLDYLEESDNEDADIIRELINNLKKL